MALNEDILPPKPGIRGYHPDTAKKSHISTVSSEPCPENSTYTMREDLLQDLAQRHPTIQKILGNIENVGFPFETQMDEHGLAVLTSIHPDEVKQAIDKIREAFKGVL